MYTYTIAMSNTFFSSDHHFFHSKIIENCSRPFKNIEEMNEILISNWNKVVSTKDTIYYLGDFGFGKVDSLLHIFKRLNGNKILAGIGNHDKKQVIKLPWGSIHNMLEVKVKEHIIQLCHYPFRSWNKSFHGSWALSGHTHGTLKPFGFSCDVGVDCWNYTPVNIETIEVLFSKLPRYDATMAGAMPDGKIWQGHECMLSFKDAFFGDGTYDNIDPEIVEKKDPNEFR
jgi:calcineurin-like phosphoesterase family protein